MGVLIRLILSIMPMMFNVIVGAVANYNYTIEHISVLITGDKPETPEN